MNKIEHASQLHACPHEECAEPVKGPSDEEIELVVREVTGDMVSVYTENDRAFYGEITAAILSRYGNAAQPARDEDAACNWSLEDYDCNIWETACGNTFILADGTPRENDMKYCCYCGERVTIDKSMQQEAQP